MSRALQHQLHTRITLAAQVLDLPLTADHLERLAVELTPAIKALLAEAVAAAEESAPIRCTLTPKGQTGEMDGVRITEYASCISRIGVDVDETAPAALLAAELRGQRPDVTATDVPTATYLGLTVRPQSAQAWRWWLEKLGIPAEAVTEQGTAAYAVGVVGDVAVEVRGDGVPALLAAERAAVEADRITRRIAPTQTLAAGAQSDDRPRCANPTCGRPIAKGAVWCSTWCQTGELPGQPPGGW